MAEVHAKMDFVNNGQAHGVVAERLLTQGRLNINAMRPFVGKDGRSYITAYDGGNPSKKESYRAVPANYEATLRRDEWKQLDDAVVGIARQRLGGVEDLLSRGLSYNLNGMSTTVLEYHDISDAMTAEMSMDGVVRGQGDRPVYGVHYLPLPIIHVDFEINQRVLEVSRKMGNPHDTTGVELATRKVLEKRESLLFTPTTYTFGGGTIYSYLNHPNRNAVTLSANWDTVGITGADILDDVKNMKQASIDDNHFGPWMIYIPTAYETKMEDDYTTNYPKSIRSRLLEIEGILGIKVVDTLTANNVVMVQMSSDVVRMINGMGVQVVEWQTEGKLITKYKVMLIQVPQIRADQEGHSGLIHLSA